MEELTILFMVLTIAMVVIAYVCKRGNMAVAAMGAVMGLCTICVIALDETVTGWYLSLLLIPTIMMVGLATIKAVEGMTRS